MKMEKGPIVPVHRRQISSATIDRILSMISEGFWEPGECLPPQRELAKSLGVGMSTLREALQSLQTMGVLEMRHGSGTYVSNQPFTAYGKIIDVSVGLASMDLEMFFEARGIIESGLAYLAAQHATDEQISKLFEILDGELEYIDEENNDLYHDLDLSFHRLVSEMANNQFLEQINDALFKVLDRLLTSNRDFCIAIQNLAANKGRLEASFCCGKSNSRPGPIYSIRSNAHID